MGPGEEGLISILLQCYKCVSLGMLVIMKLTNGKKHGKTGNDLKISLEPLGLAMPHTVSPLT